MFAWPFLCRLSLYVTVCGITALRSQAPLANFNPGFCTLATQAGKIRDYLDKHEKIPSRFSRPTLRANFARLLRKQAKFGLIFNFWTNHEKIIYRFRYL